MRLCQKNLQLSRRRPSFVGGVWFSRVLELIVDESNETFIMRRQQSLNARQITRCTTLGVGNLYYQRTISEEFFRKEKIKLHAAEKTSKMKQKPHLIIIM